MDDVKEKLCYVAEDATEESSARRARPGERDQQGIRASDGCTSRAGTSRRPARDPDARRATTTTRTRARVAGKNHAGSGKRRRLSGEGVVKGSTFVEQTLGMGNERFMVPEVLFHPRIGLNQAGIAEAAAQAVRSVQPDLRGMPTPTSSPRVRLFRGSRNASRRSSDRSCPRRTSWGDPRGGSRGDGVAGGSVVGAGADFERLAVTREEYEKDPGEFRRRYEEHVAVIRGRA